MGDARVEGVVPEFEGVGEASDRTVLDTVGTDSGRTEGAPVTPEEAQALVEEGGEVRGDVYTALSALASDELPVILIDEERAAA